MRVVCEVMMVVESGGLEGLPVLARGFSLYRPTARSYAKRTNHLLQIPPLLGSMAALTRGRNEEYEASSFVNVEAPPSVSGGARKLLTCFVDCS